MALALNFSLVLLDHFPQLDGIELFQVGFAGSRHHLFDLVQFILPVLHVVQTRVMQVQLFRHAHEVHSVRVALRCKQKPDFAHLVVRKVHPGLGASLLELAFINRALLLFVDLDQVPVNLFPLVGYFSLNVFLSQSLEVIWAS